MDQNTQMYWGIPPSIPTGETNYKASYVLAMDSAMVFGRNTAMAAVRELGARHTHLRCRLMFGKWWVSLSGKRGDTLTYSYPLRFPFFVVMLTISLSFMDYFFKVNKIKLLIYGFISTHKKTTFSGLYLVCKIEMWLIWSRLTKV